MQIHELTKRRKTNEGLLSSLGSAISAAKTGYDAGKQSGKSTGASLGQAAKTFGRAATSNAFQAQNSWDKNAKDANEKYQALKDKFGWKDAGDQPASGAATGQAPAAPASQAEVAKVTKEITSTPEFADLSQVLPDPGRLLFVTMKNGGKYYKDENGVWKTENGDAIQGTPGTPGYGKAFDKILDADQYTQVPLTSVPFGATSGTAAASTKTNPNRTPVTPVTPAATPQVKEARNPMATRSAASVVKGIIAKNKALAQKLSDPAVQPAVQAASAKLDTIAKTRGEAAKSKKKKMYSAAQAMAKAVVGNGTGAVQAGNTAPAGDQAQAGQDQQAQVTKPNPVIQKAGLQDLKAAGAQDSTIADLTKLLSTPNGPTAIKKVAGVAESRKPLTQQLEEAIQMLKEDQVYITKDIRIRTAKGDYVKRASDQTWYDPNGVAIDPVKYADYVKKLDATPMAQTQYQADAQKAAKGKGPGGTDTGAHRAAKEPPKAPPPKAPPPAAPQEDPMDQMLKQQKMQQWLRGQNVDSLNAQIKDTTNQLRNAQIFGTGQADYLQQQLAQLIAMKV